ncbi:uncharacterized protein STEHIDRAFT_149232 [Stereum hirsutum FP-91666 SS1]|uniref:uncharacterized protein n=1 Tax=Stereum hirsutum (strain FP-91666) TaxID=721885 RepID=UPI0004449774|nr:uncharacterized protein STEHIDRAFT_149232 [Stereum hirsutum FP-91666 SS1]EIM82879.1 hypothetical protein STEHIDRAFT_149232 [Stereum hirsutum FP-91666 SS1]
MLQHPWDTPLEGITISSPLTSSKTRRIGNYAHHPVQCRHKCFVQGLASTPSWSRTSCNRDIRCPDTMEVFHPDALPAEHRRPPLLSTSSAHRGLYSGLLPSGAHLVANLLLHDGRAQQIIS